MLVSRIELDLLLSSCFASQQDGQKERQEGKEERKERKREEGS